MDTFRPLISLPKNLPFAINSEPQPFFFGAMLQITGGKISNASSYSISSHFFPLILISYIPGGNALLISHTIFVSLEDRALHFLLPIYTLADFKQVPVMVILVPMVPWSGEIGRLNWINSQPPRGFFRISREVHRISHPEVENILSCGLVAKVLWR